MMALLFKLVTTYTGRICSIDCYLFIDAKLGCATKIWCLSVFSKIWAVGYKTAGRKAFVLALFHDSWVVSISNSPFDLFSVYPLLFCSRPYCILWTLIMLAIIFVLVFLNLFAYSLHVEAQTISDWIFSIRFIGLSLSIWSARWLGITPEFDCLVSALVQNALDVLLIWLQRLIALIERNLACFCILHDFEDLLPSEIAHQKLEWNVLRGSRSARHRCEPLAALRRLSSWLWPLMRVILELAQIKEEVVDFLRRVLKFSVACYGLLLELAYVASIVAVQGVGRALKSRLPFRYFKRAVDSSADIE